MPHASTARRDAIPRGAVLVGVDGTESSGRAAEWAAEHARLEALPLALLHVVDDTVEATAWAGVTWILPTPVDRLLASGRAVAQHAADHVASTHPGLEVHPLAVRDDLRRTLVEASRDTSIIVLGAPGRVPVGAALGSLGAHVTRHAHCPVVVCRPSRPGLVRDGVVVVTDGTPTAEPIVVRALEIAADRGLPLTVLRCVPTAAEAAIAHPALEHELSRLRAHFPGTAVRAEVFAGDLDAALAARPRPPDLVVVGRHPVGERVRQLDPLTSSRPVEHLEHPVLVVPQAG